MCIGIGHWTVDSFWLGVSSCFPPCWVSKYKLPYLLSYLSVPQIGPCRQLFVCLFCFKVYLCSGDTHLNPSIQEAKAGRSLWVWGQPGVQSKFQYSWDYTEKPCQDPSNPPKEIERKRKTLVVEKVSNKGGVLFLVNAIRVFWLFSSEPDLT